MKYHCQLKATNYDTHYNMNELKKYESKFKKASEKDSLYHLHEMSRVTTYFSVRNIYKRHTYTGKKQTMVAYDESESRNSVQAGTRGLREMTEMF